MLFWICSYVLPIFYFFLYKTVMIYNLEIGIMTEQKPERKRPVLILMLEESETWLSQV